GQERFVFAADDKACNAIINDFRDGTAAKSDGGSAASHGFDHRESERLRPVNREEIRESVSQKLSLFGFIDFAEELNSRRTEEGLDFGFEIFLIRGINFGGDF